jgi:hypothetical protein
VSEGGDRSIVQTCLREMEEEIGIGHNAATVLGVLRCNWGEVRAHSFSFSRQYVQLTQLTSCPISFDAGSSFGGGCCYASCVFPWRNRDISTKSQSGGSGRMFFCSA